MVDYPGSKVDRRLMTNLQLLPDLTFTPMIHLAWPCPCVSQTSVHHQNPNYGKIPGAIYFGDFRTSKFSQGSEINILSKHSGDPWTTLWNHYLGSLDINHFRITCLREYKSRHLINENTNVSLTSQMYQEQGDSELSLKNCPST